jgi:hypothetical protein
MPHINRDPVTAETDKQILACPHDSGSAANETVDGLDATTEPLRHAAEDTRVMVRARLRKHRYLTALISRRKSELSIDNGLGTSF